ncbi:hypothetical protein NX801_28205 [Streptomyces sp. LP05-1]|uniref:Lipoprotein n=1 Tax=Streptomyces pyxinae TaxID=2970734 RepID=A0ABT2CPT1_9ACTN|nr:hypothetical protein [Streptomyces sp. LP05-1]MCS0639447.1 hypothetical protein [Streptomyces sp. LP05-1]
MTDAKGSGDTPSAGTSTSSDAADKAEKVSSELYDLIGVKGKSSQVGAGVSGCSGKDREKYFTVFHPWTLTPASPTDLDAVVERLKDELPQHGWKVVEYGRDTSKNKNLALTADNDAKKHSVQITALSTKPAKLEVMVVSGCYQIPDGEEIERF